MRVQGTPRQLASVRKPDYRRLVYATDPVEMAGVVAGSLGTVDGIYHDGSVLVRYHGGEHGTVLYNKPALRRSTKPFDWVYLAAKRCEVATLYVWK